MMMQNTKKRPNIPSAMHPFADVASDGLPLGRLLRLSLFQISVGMASVLLLGTLNRVMIVELLVPTYLVALMVAIPVLIAPFRAFLGFRSDNYRSAIGWRRVPYIWFGSLWQFGGLAIMPMALLVLSGDTMGGPAWVGVPLCALAFLLTGLGMHMTQTAGLALASDLADDATRPKVVALLYVMFLIGMGISALVIGALLRDYSPLKLIQVIQGAALLTLILNLIALWKQEVPKPQSKDERMQPMPFFSDAWRDLMGQENMKRLIWVIVLGTAAFSMQDVLLEPYGGEVLGMSVSATTLLTAFWALGALLGFGFSSYGLAQGGDAYLIAARGIYVGILAFPLVILSGPLNLTFLFFLGAGLIGMGSGIFAVATLTAVMIIPLSSHVGRGLALGAWGAAQASAVGLATAFGGAIRDGVSTLATGNHLGTALNGVETGYSFVYHLEIGLLFGTLIALGPMVRRHAPSDRRDDEGENRNRGFGLPDFPN